MAGGLPKVVSATPCLPHPLPGRVMVDKSGIHQAGFERALTTLRNIPVWKV